MRYAVVLRDGQHDFTLASTRRLNGALAELDIAVESKRAQLERKARAGERVVEGPDDPAPDEVAATCVVLVGPGIEASYRYAVVHTNVLTRTPLCDTFCVSGSAREKRMTEPNTEVAVVAADEDAAEMAAEWYERLWKDAR